MKKRTYLEEDISKKNLGEIINNMDPLELERERFQGTEFEKTFNEHRPGKLIPEDGTAKRTRK